MRTRISMLLVFASSLVCGQNDSSKIYDLSARFLYSSIWTGRVSLQPFTQDHPWALQVDFGVLKNTQQAWNYCNCYSRNGISAGYINFANSTHLGNAFTFSFFTEPILLLRERFTLYARGSAGVALLNKVYDSVSNKENIFFSTKLSYYLGMGLTAAYQINNKIKLSASGQLNHISNGGKKDPNEGMNFPSLNFSVSFGINPQKLKRRPYEEFKYKSFGLIAHVFGAQRAAPATAILPEEKRAVTGVNAGLIKRIGRLNAFGVGGEIYYDGINSVNQQRTGLIQQTTMAGVGVHHYLFLGKLLFGQQVGWFVTPSTGYRKNFYQRYMLEYEVKKNWYAGVSLKAHGDHSDYLSFIAGYHFRF